MIPDPDVWTIVDSGSASFGFTGAPDSWSVPAARPGLTLIVEVSGRGGRGEPATGLPARQRIQDPDDAPAALVLGPEDTGYGDSLTVNVGGDASGTLGGYPDGGLGGAGIAPSTSGHAGGGSTRLGTIVIAGTGGGSGDPGVLYDGALGGPTNPHGTPRADNSGGTDIDVQTGTVAPSDFNGGGNPLFGIPGTAGSSLSGGDGADALADPVAGGGVGGGGGGGGDPGGAGGWASNDTRGLHPFIDSNPTDYPDPPYVDGHRFVYGWGAGNDGTGTGLGDLAYGADTSANGELGIRWWFVRQKSGGWRVGSLGFA